MKGRHLRSHGAVAPSCGRHSSSLFGMFARLRFLISCLCVSACSAQVCRWKDTRWRGGALHFSTVTSQSSSRFEGGVRIHPHGTWSASRSVMGWFEMGFSLRPVADFVSFM